MSGDSHLSEPALAQGSTWTTHLAAIRECGIIRAKGEEAGLPWESHRHGVPVAVARLVPDANGETDLGRWGVAS